MKTLTVALFFCVLLMAGCQFNKSESTTDNHLPVAVEPAQTETPEVSEVLSHEEEEEEKTPLTDDEIRQQVREYLEPARRLREELVAKLEIATPEEADNIFLAGGYRFMELPDTPYPPEFVHGWMYRVESGWEYTGERTALDDEILEMFRAEGIEPMQEGEGYIGLYTIPEFFYEIFAPYVTEETRAYMEIHAAYEGFLSYDAALALSPGELYERSVRWENYLTVYPEGTYYRQAIREYALYMALQMYCTYDNTPMFYRFDEKKEVDEYRFEQIKELIGKNPGSQTDMILQAYVDGVEANDRAYSEELKDTILSMGILKEANWDNLYY